MKIHNKTTFIYTSSTHVKENHGANIFGVAFNTLLGKDEPQVFATAGSNRCTVYECPRKGGLTLLHCYADPDVSTSTVLAKRSHCN